MASSAKLRRRALMDVRALEKWCADNGLEFREVDEGEKVLTVCAGMRGPDETPYAGGVFTICCQLPDTYPIKSPSVAFKTKIWHPNVEREQGAVCLDVLRDRWSPAVTLVNVLDAYLPELLRNPNKADPINSVAAAMMAHEEEYKQYVRQFTRKYAMGDDTVELADLTLLGFDAEYQ